MNNAFGIIDMKNVCKMVNLVLIAFIPFACISLEDEPPPAPSDFRLVSLELQGVQISWKDRSDGNAEYLIEKERVMCR